MGTTVLVAPEIDMGSAVVGALEDAGIHVAVAMWAVLDDYGDWRMIIASQDFADDDVTGSYTRVIKAIQGKFLLPAPTITIFNMGTPFVAELRKIFTGAAETYGMRLGGQIFGGKYIHDAFVYCIR